MLSLTALIPIATSSLKALNRLISKGPKVWTVAEPFHAHGKRYLYLVVHNRLQVPIRVTSIDVTPGFFSIMGGHDEESGERYLNGEKAAVFIDPGEEKRLPIVMGSSLDQEENRHIPCSVWVYWRSMQRPGLRRFPVVFQTQLEALEAQRDDRP